MATLNKFLALTDYKLGEPIYLKKSLISAIKQFDGFAGVFLQNDQAPFLVREKAENIITEVD